MDSFSEWAPDVTVSVGSSLDQAGEHLVACLCLHPITRGSKIPDQGVLVDYQSRRILVKARELKIHPEWLLRRGDAADNALRCLISSMPSLHTIALEEVNWSCWDIPLRKFDSSRASINGKRAIQLLAEALHANRSQVQSLTIAEVFNSWLAEPPAVPLQSMFTGLTTLNISIYIDTGTATGLLSLSNLLQISASTLQTICIRLDLELNPPITPGCTDQLFFSMEGAHLDFPQLRQLQLLWDSISWEWLGRIFCHQKRLEQVVCLDLQPPDISWRSFLSLLPQSCYSFSWSDPNDPACRTEVDDRRQVQGWSYERKLRDTPGRIWRTFSRNQAVTKTSTPPSQPQIVFPDAAWITPRSMGNLDGIPDIFIVDLYRNRDQLAEGEQWVAARLCYEGFFPSKGCCSEHHIDIRQ